MNLPFIVCIFSFSQHHFLVLTTDAFSLGLQFIANQHYFDSNFLQSPQPQKQNYTNHLIKILPITNTIHSHRSNLFRFNPTVDTQTNFNPCVGLSTNQISLSGYTFIYKDLIHFHLLDTLTCNYISNTKPQKCVLAQPQTHKPE